MGRAGADVYLHGVGIGAGVFDGVVHEVLHHFGPILGVGQERGHAEVGGDAQGLGALGCKAFGQRVQQGLQGQGLGRHVHLVVLQLRDGQYLVGEGQQVVGLVAGYLEVAVAQGGLVVQAAFVQGAQGHDDAGEGRLERGVFRSCTMA